MSILVPEQHRSLDLDLGDSATPCRTNDAELWFADAAEDVERAQRLCGQCPVRVACLTGALARREPWGVWGGELFEQGVPVARKRRPGRPRKDDHLDRHAAEQALAERLAAEDLDRELDLLVAERLTGLTA
ncbi:MAG TPA: WhiB family transcriptional regulator [Candidatus Nanopelagicales bacterium]|jgi:WhiB family redox-sensing transcriptional regulator|nr:WhiB family transcriptional regulator [Candidatus Nanopelagicales bacterium]